VFLKKIEVAIKCTLGEGSNIIQH